MFQPQADFRPAIRLVLEAYTSVTAATYTAKAGDRVIGVNRADTVTVTLPTAEVRKGRVYTVKDESGGAAANNITVATEGPETIDGSATNVIGDDYGSVTYYSDGINWFTVPLLAAPAHTLASHAARAHADLSDAPADAHHAQSQDISARVTHSIAQSLSNNTGTVLAFDTERFDTDTIHDTSTNNSRLTAKTAGVYIITGSANFVANATGERFIEIRLNGTTNLGINRSTTNQGVNTHSTTIAVLYKLAVNDYVELLTYQNSGGSLNVNSTGNFSPEFAMAKVLG